MKTVSIIIPVYNEQDRIAKALTAVIKAKTPGYTKEIIIVNDGSTDKTSAKIKNQISKLKQKNTSDQRPTSIGLTTIDLQTNMGKGAALKAGIRKAKGDILLVQDADLEYSVDDYPALLAPFAKGAKVVYGTRNKMRKEFNTKYSTLPFYWGGIVLTWIVNVLFGTRLTDQATGYKLFHKDLKELLLMPHEDRFAYEVAVTGVLSDAGYAITEVPIHYSPRKSGEGKKIRPRDFFESIVTAVRLSALKVFVVSLPIILILLFWRESIFHFSTRIHDWLDGTFMIWTMQNNIKHFTSLSFNRLYETNAMYPFTNSLSMTDHFYFPSLIATIVSFFSSNYFLQFNFITVGNHLLLYLSFYLLAGRFTNNIVVKVLGAFYFALGPYYFLQLGHLQMVFVWPLIISLYFLFDPALLKRSQILSGIWMGIQFLSSTYLGVMGIIASTLFYFIRYTQSVHKKIVIKHYLLHFATFLFVAGISIMGYIRINSVYQPIRDQGQYVSYAAHISDYLFPQQKSLLYSLFDWWMKADKHSSSEKASFIGIMPILVFAIWLVKRGWKQIQSKTLFLWLLLLISIGFIFSLGPRFNFNGEYLVTPLPYLALLKAVPAIGIIRATARWYVYIHLAISLLLVLLSNFFIQAFPKKTGRVILLSLILIAIFEFTPNWSIKTIDRVYIRPSDVFLISKCKNDNGPILEYPFEYRAEDVSETKKLAAKTNTLMYSTLHTCPTLSGFSSFEPPLFKKWQTDFDTNGIGERQLQILKENNFKYIRVNQNFLTQVERANFRTYIQTDDVAVIYADKIHTIYQIQ